MTSIINTEINETNIWNYIKIKHTQLRKKQTDHSTFISGFNPLLKLVLYKTNS